MSKRQMVIGIIIAFLIAGLAEHYINAHSNEIGGVFTKLTGLPRHTCKQFWEGECVDRGLWVDPLANKLMPH